MTTDSDENRAGLRGASDPVRFPATTLLVRDPREDLDSDSEFWRVLLGLAYPGSDIHKALEQMRTEGARLRLEDDTLARPPLPTGACGSLRIRGPVSDLRRFVGRVAELERVAGPFLDALLRETVVRYDPAREWKWR